MMAFILFIALIVAVLVFGLTALTMFDWREAAMDDVAPTTDAPVNASGILRARYHDVPYQRGQHIRFADATSERAYSKSTGRVGPAREVAFNDRTPRGRALPQESYPRPVSEAA